VLSLVIETHGPFTRADLINATGLSAPTVGSLTTQLMEAGVVKSLGMGPSRGGRRPGFMAFNSRYGFVGGIDLGPHRTRIAVADLRGERVAQRVVPTPTNSSPDELLARTAEAARDLLIETQVPAGSLLALAAGAPGVVDQERGKVVALAPNLKGWADIPMAEILASALGAPVTVENDVNLAILGERWRGVARGHDTCAFLSFGTGIGAGISIEGKLHRGRHHLAGEVGFMSMAPEHLDQDYGSRGCLETLAGLRALARHWPGSGASTSPEGWVQELYSAAAADVAGARALIDETARLIAIAISNVTLVLDPSLVVLGGDLFHQPGPLLTEVQRIIEHILPRPLEIAVSELGEEAPLWGTLRLATSRAQGLLRESLCG
jgi:predicted NBD/HSP70 family sugar kinase